jgi:chemotaxis protein MotB
MRQLHSRRVQASHGDDWLMTYADTITLLLCLFVVLLCVTVARKTVVPAPPAPVAAHAIEPTPIFARAELLSRDSDNEAADDDAPAEWIRAELPVPSARRWNADAAMDEDGEKLVQKVAAVAAPLRVAPPLLPVAPGRAPPRDPPQPKPPGERIIMLQISSTAFFDSGSALLSGSGRAILHGVAGDLGSAKYLGYKVTVEGYTDDTPISSAQFPSNWELSTARASAVVRFLVDQGLPAPMLRAAGYADSFPVAPNRDAAGRPIPENQARNRRVVIELEKIEK